MPTSIAQDRNRRRGTRSIRAQTLAGPLRRALAGTVAVATVASLVVTAGPTTPVTSRSGTTEADLALVVAAQRPWPGHPGRTLRAYRVRPGDTATGLAVRFHAWTAELRSLNRLGPDGHLRVGQRITIPVVTAAARRAGAPRARERRRERSTERVSRPWRRADASRATVRRVVVRTARRHGVDPHLALAVSWQESGWQQRRISSAGAIGAMQVLPGTADWMELYVGRPLNPYGLRDNVTAGVMLLKVLDRNTTRRRAAVAAYYQGLGAVRKHGLFEETRTYTRNVLALHRRLQRGWSPV